MGDYCTGVLISGSIRVPCADNIADNSGNSGARREEINLNLAAISGFAGNSDDANAFQSLVLTNYGMGLRLR